MHGSSSNRDIDRLFQSFVTARLSINNLKLASSVANGGSLPGTPRDLSKQASPLNRRPKAAVLRQCDICPFMQTFKTRKSSSSSFVHFFGRDEINCPQKYWFNLNPYVISKGKVAISEVNKVSLSRLYKISRGSRYWIKFRFHSISVYEELIRWPKTETETI